MKGRRVGARLATVVTVMAASLTGPVSALAARREHAGGGACTTGLCRSGVPAARDLLATQQAQISDSFCGPATVSEMLDIPLVRYQGLPELRRADRL